MRRKRESVSKKRRFEIFKRDGFTCQYCGAHPPAVILHLDHIVAVANGGSSRDENLVTACQPCNSGKAATALEVIPEGLRDKAVRVAEQEAQLLGYQKIMEGRRIRLDAEVWRVLKEMIWQETAPRNHFSSVRMFIEKLGFDEVFDAAEKAMNKGVGDYDLFRYFCGICWSKIKQAQQ